MHLPSWAYKLLAAIGGFGFIFQQLIKPMLSYLTNRIWRYRDEPVWEVLRAPKFKTEFVQGSVTHYSKDEAPYSLDELAERTHRSKGAARRSVHRLERRGKVKEVHGGWQRKEK